jgi:uncharacterized protein
MKRLLPSTLLLAALVPFCAAATPLPDAVAPKAAAVLSPADPSQVHLGGWIGARIDANVANRLLVVDTEPLLAGYRKRPGEQAWIGEHVGKWLHAATLAWAYTGNPDLRRKLDSVAADLIATQEPDGYLGTYVPEHRFGIFNGDDWDVWAHKYNIIGLLTYYRYTGNPAALAACRKMGDLLIATFPAKRSIVDAGDHVGLAATSVMTAMVQLYRATGDERYLAFCRYILKAYGDKDGPDLVRALLAGKGVNHVANGKAYEMMSNLVGIVELYGVTADPDLLKAAENAWADIRANRLYITGSVSSRECFNGDHDLPNGESAHLGETCATVTWIQLNAALLAQTGDSRYADEIERSVYNHLAAAQDPRGDDWCYYTALEGKKHYDKEITCCHSSGPRGMILAPTLAYLQGADTLYVSTFETSEARFSVDSAPVALSLASAFPFHGHATLTIHNSAGKRFAVAVRVPQWASPVSAAGASAPSGWLMLPKKAWRDGEQVEIAFSLGSRVIAGDYGNFAHLAYSWGPFVLALDEALNPSYEVYDAPQYIRVIDSKPAELVSAQGALVLQTRARGEWDIDPHPVKLVPFADAGASGKPYAVWLREP